MTAATSNALVYVGAAGAGLGFQLAGIDAHNQETADAMLKHVRQLKDEGLYRIIFVDEALAQPVLADLEKLNEDALPAIVLLPNPATPLNVASEKMNNLVIKAVGSDIFSSKQ